MDSLVQVEFNGLGYIFSSGSSRLQSWISAFCVQDMFLLCTLTAHQSTGSSLADDFQRKALYTPSLIVINHGPWSNKKTIRTIRLLIGSSYGSGDLMRLSTLDGLW